MKKIIIEVRDDAPLGKALEGTIRLTGENEGVFTEWKRSTRDYRVMERRVYKRLLHGRVSASKDDLRLTLCIDRHESRFDDETLTQVLEFDCTEACATTKAWEEGVLKSILLN